MNGSITAFRGLFISLRGMASRNKYHEIRFSSTAAASKAEKQYESLAVSIPSPFVYHVELNRPKQLNAINTAMWRELSEAFKELSDNKDCRVVVLSGSGRLFCAGIDFTDVQELFNITTEDDIARRCKAVYKSIKFCQEGISAIEKCVKPVISAIHGGCIGGGLDMVSASDIRICSTDAWFQIKEVDIGMAADVGTLQRLPKAIGSRSLINELALTGRKLPAAEAKECGLVNSIHPDKESLLKSAFEMAVTIASKSPVAVQLTKQSLLYSRDHTVDEGLEHIASWNQIMLQSEDFMNAAMATATKSPPPTFSKL